QRVLDNVAKLFQPGYNVGQMYTESPAAAVGEHLEIAPRLCRFYDPKCVFASRDRQVDAIITGDLEKHTAVRAAFVCLASGVQVAGAKSQGSGHTFAIAHTVADLLQVPLVVLVHLQVGE